MKFFLTFNCLFGFCASFAQSECQVDVFMDVDYMHYDRHFYRDLRRRYSATDKLPLLFLVKEYLRFTYPKIDSCLYQPFTPSGMMKLCSDDQISFNNPIEPNEVGVSFMLEKYSVLTGQDSVRPNAIIYTGLEIRLDNKVTFRFDSLDLQDDDRYLFLLESKTEVFFDSKSRRVFLYLDSTKNSWSQGDIIKIIIEDIDSVKPRMTLLKIPDFLAEGVVRMDMKCSRNTFCSRRCFF